MHLKKANLKQETNRADDVMSTLYDTATALCQARLALMNKMANSEELRQIIRDKQRSLSVAGRLVDFTVAYNSNPFPDISNSAYASANLLTEVLQEHLTKLSLTAVFGEEIAASVMGGPAAVLIGTSQLIDIYYPQIMDQLENEQKWYKSLNIPEERQAAMQAMQAFSVSNAEGMTFTIQGLVTLNHYILEKVKEAKQWSGGIIASVLENWQTYLVPDTFWYLQDLVDRGQSIIETIGKPIDTVFQVGSLISDVMNQNDLPFGVAQQVVAYQFLQGTSYAGHVQGDFLHDYIKLPEGISKESLLDEIDHRISENSALKSIKEQLAQQQSLAEQLAEQQKLEKLTNKGYSDAMQLGSTVSQFGQLVNSKTLVQAGQVFQHGIKIIGALQDLKLLDSAGIFQKLGALNFGPVSTIASAVMSLISLFHKTGPTADEIILKQIQQIQTGIQQIMQNQAVILDAIGTSYINLLNAIHDGVQQLANLMHAEFNQVADEFYILSNQLEYYAHEILTEIRRVELSIEQDRLAPLRNALENSDNLKHRHTDTSSQLYEQDVRNTMRILEQWGSETVCDPSFTGSTEPDYAAAVRDYNIIYRHFPRDEIKLHDALTQSGFLLGLFNSLVPTANNTKIQTCNMELWSQIVFSYRNIVPYSIAFSYDPAGVLFQKILQSASQTKDMVSLFQKNSNLLMANLQNRIITDIHEIVNNCEADLIQLKVDLTNDYRNELKAQREQLIALIAGIHELPQIAHTTRVYNGRPVESEMLSIISASTLQDSARKYLSDIDRRIEAADIDLSKPLSSLMTGQTLSIFVPGPFPGLPPAVDSPSYVRSSLLTPAFPFFSNNALEKILRPLVRAEILGSGKISANFVYTPSVWNSGVLRCVTTLQFNCADGTQFTIAEVNWQGEAVANGFIFYPPDFHLAASFVLNSLPLFPWSNDCNPLMVNNLLCIKWYYTISYVIDSLNPKVKSIVEMNHAKMLERIQSLQIADELRPDGDRSFLYDALASKWRLYKAFAIAIGIDTDLIDTMNQFNIMDMLVDEIATIKDDAESNEVEISSLEPRIQARFAPFFNGVMNQTLAMSGNSSSITTLVYTSSLSNFIDQVFEDSKLMLAQKNIHREALAFNQRRDLQLLPLLPQQLTSTDTFCLDEKSRSSASHESWFSWPVFLGTIAAIWAPIAMLAAYGCIVQRRRAQVGQVHNGYFEMGQIGRAALFIANLPRVFSELVSVQSSESIEFISSQMIAAFSFQGSDRLTNESIGVLPLLDHSYQYEEVYCHGIWDANIQLHSYTAEPIFTYRAYCDGIEVGTAEFYKHPLICRSIDGTRHNLIRLTGMFSHYDMPENLNQVTEVCAALPPTSLDKFTDGVNSGVQHGIIRGTSKLVEKAMVQQGYSLNAAHQVRTACYYLTLFAANTAQHFAADTENSDEFERTKNAIQLAAIDTAQLAIASCVITKVCDTLSWAANKVDESGWHRTASVVNKLAQYGGLSIYAYNTRQQGLAHLAGNVAGGYVAETAVGLMGNAVLTMPRN